MTIQEIKEIVANKVRVLEQQKANCYQSGDLSGYDKASAELEETAKTLSELEAL